MAGIVLALLALGMAATAVMILFAPIDANDFEATVGESWEAFSTDNPSAADYLTREARLLASGYLGLALFALVIVWSRLRSGDVWAVKVLWIFPATLGLAAVVFFTSDGPVLGWAYVVGTLVAAGALIAGRQIELNFEPIARPSRERVRWDGQERETTRTEKAL